MSKRRKPATGGIPNFAITLRSTPGIESMCLSTTQNGIQVIIVGATFKEALKHVEKKAAIALERIKLEETMKAEEE